MREVVQFQFICVIALFPLRSQEYNILNGGRREGGQDTNEMEVLNRYNEMHTKDYGESQLFYNFSSGQALSALWAQRFLGENYRENAISPVTFFSSKLCLVLV